MRLVLIGGLALTACGRIGFDPRTDGGTGSNVDAMDMLVLEPSFGTPTLITELNSTALDDDPTLTADELEIVFSSGRAGSIGGTDLWGSSGASRSDPWQPPRDLAEISTSNNESNATLSTDGLALVFSSGPLGNQDMYYATRPSRTDLWSAAVPLSVLNSGTTDFAGSMTDSLDTLYFASSRAGSLDIYVARGSVGAWTSPTEISELKTTTLDSSPFVMYDETVIWFASDRPGTAGDQDIYVAQRPSRTAPFGPAVHIVELATALEDSDPHVSRDGHIIYFSRTTATGTDLYMATR